MAEEKKSSEGLILKEFPEHLKQPEKGNPIIISARLIKLEEQRLLETLRKYKEAIAWSLEDLKGISPSVCMHKILLEENARTLIEHQRRLNPLMKEVVRKKSTEMGKCRLHICNFRQSLGEPSTCGSQEGRTHCDQK